MALLLFSCHGIKAEDRPYQINETNITINDTCRISLQDISQALGGIDLYGDVGKGGYGNNKDLFEQLTSSLNPHIKGIEFKKEIKEVGEQGPAFIVFKEIGSEDITINLYKGKKILIKGKPDWTRDDSNPIILSIHYQNELKDEKTGEEKAEDKDNETDEEKDDDSEQTENADFSELIQDLEKSPIDNGYHNKIQDEIIKKNAIVTEDLANRIYNIEENGGNSIFSWGTILGGLALLLSAYSLYSRKKEHRRIDEEIHRQERQTADLETKIKNYAPNRNGASKVSPTSQAIALNAEDIKRLITKEVNERLERQKQPVQVVEEAKAQTLDTTDITFNYGDSYFSLETNDKPIFRVYSKNGSYYYTLVDNASVREELIGVIQSLSNYITYQSSTGIAAKRVEPVKDGELRRDGDRFHIVKPLEVKFVN